MNARIPLLAVILLGQTALGFGQETTVSPRSLQEPANPAATPGASDPGPTNPNVPSGAPGRGPTSDREPAPHTQQGPAAPIPNPGATTPNSR